MRFSNLCLASVALGLLLAGGSRTAHAELITNGTFDTDLAGWTIGGDIDTTWVSGTAHIGQPGTPGESIFEQSFDIPSGAEGLKISFDYEWQVMAPTVYEDSFLAELIYESTSGTETVTLLDQNSNDGVFGTSIAFSSTILLSDLDNSIDNGTIRFTLTENNSPVGTRIELDNVQVNPVPEPSTYAGLLGITCVSLCAYGWRRKRQPAA
ncbi:PEP-CTERM sorting domain-containing protein [Symmachiella dynata]|uniref:PEP-CTERM sorting domain-containing protein n=1 Tax=Symmachiella dynata TaxID=2527995 RepID=UPI0030EE6FAF